MTDPTKVTSYEAVLKALESFTSQLQHYEPVPMGSLVGMKPDDCGQYLHAADVIEQVQRVIALIAPERVANGTVLKEMRDGTMNDRILRDAAASREQFYKTTEQVLYEMGEEELDRSSGVIAGRVRK